MSTTLTRIVFLFKFQLISSWKRSEEDELNCWIESRVIPQATHGGGLQPSNFSYLSDNFEFVESWRTKLFVEKSFFPFFIFLSINITTLSCNYVYKCKNIQWVTTVIYYTVRWEWVGETRTWMGVNSSGDTDSSMDIIYVY